jgi:hypothetical protein
MPTIKDSEGNEHELRVGQLVQVTKYEGVRLMRIDSLTTGFAYAYDRVSDGSVTRTLDEFTWISDEPIGEEKEPTLQQRRSRFLTNLDRAYRMSNLTDRMILSKLTYAIYKEDGENVWFWSSVAESMDDPRQFSYAPTKEAYDINAKRKRCRVAKFLKTVAKRFGLELTNAEADRIGELVGAHFPDSYDYQFEVVRDGSATYDGYADRANDGWGSCMHYNGETRAHRSVCWYDENPDKVGLVKIKQGQNYVGRALIWNTDCGAVVVDRCYPGDNGPQTTALHNWAIKNGYDYKTSQSYVDGCLRSGRSDYRVTMKRSGNGDYPYCDTFKYTDDPPDDSDTIVLNTEEGEYKFSNTDGGWEGESERFFCEDCGERLSEQDVFTCDNGYAYCECCYDSRFTHLDYTNPNGRGRCGTYSNDDVRGCDCCREDRHHNDLCDVEVGARTRSWCLSCVEDNATTCEECGNLCDNEQGTEVGDEWVCNDCQQEPPVKQEVKPEAPAAVEVDSYPTCGPIMRPREECCEICVAVRRRRYDEFNSRRRWNPDTSSCQGRACYTCDTVRAERDAYVNAPYPNDEESAVLRQREQAGAIRQLERVLA